ncbi:hypothetical protein [Acetobacter indonesiensis]|uniref:hypothetical protein n=1 Tax=Acetobacter indonesiensis TaxID=104101 RepID=UPI0039ECB43A
MNTEIFEVENFMKSRPHVVILGAGATVAAIPHGDKNGKKSSVMDGFIEKLGMSDIIKNTNIQTKSNNLEDIYTELSERDDCVEIINILDQKIRDYFSELAIPDNPNIYDFIILSLRNKDIIATFNWDPLLIQAYNRVSQITNNLPDLAFLHGNVCVGYCRNHKQGGAIPNKCGECGEYFDHVKLLYPIKNKKYSEDPYIKDNWKALRNALKRAYYVTIFGYSAPTTDAEAIAILQEAWGISEERNFEQFEIIDIKEEKEIIKSWSPFIHTHHYDIHKNFFDSSLANYPRRTTDVLFDRTMNCKIINPLRKFDPSMSWEEVKDLIDSLVSEETDQKDNFLSSDIVHQDDMPMVTKTLPVQPNNKFTLDKLIEKLLDAKKHGVLGTDPVNITYLNINGDKEYKITNVIAINTHEVDERGGSVTLMIDME